ncbi:transcription factor [Aspergillus oryzae 3.042]|uniref:Transcription factor n=1 Tax=Aspergillus oryzae (strain 3.042) TaxID=1160506 RepID=I8TJE3_ASPO3|nr:transcription factor [Aspergillus oryzae 3.042]|eukprot:EIT73873.1 transcription factor [Aspergillus oryzae 3.042]
MSDAPAPVAEGSASRPRPSRRGGRGRGNRNHRRPQTQATERSHDAQAAQPPTQQSSQLQPTQNSPSDLPADAPRSRRGPRRGRGGGRGDGAPSEGSSRRQRQRGGDRGTTSTGRRFEGRLTKPEQAPEGEQVDTAVDANDLGLRADAPAFVPGTQSEPVANEPTPSTTSAPTKKKPKAKNAPPPPPKVTTKSVAPDIATRIHEDIAHNLYECPICTAELGRRSRVWNCGLCWTVFHLSCVKKWSKNEGAAAQDSARRQGEGTLEHPQCFRVCKAGLHCGRHACAERCCPGEQKAVERQALRRKLKSHLRPSDEDVEAEHICTRVCGRMLKCGRHTCPELCHKGPCNTCREAIFEEISCNCGRSVLYPPLPCGTQPPPCSAPCERPKSCGHPQTPHNCHTDEEECPKCPYLTEKMCLCGKQILKNVPCWLADARCGRICGETLKCGSHTCQKNCHRPGDCEDTLKPCQQPCGKTKTMCGHPCTEPCHAPYPCPEKTPCSSMITVTCGCGRLRQERRCNAAKAVASKGQLQQPQRLPAVTPLTCDDECARLERNRSLASALGVDINPSTTVAQNATASLPYSSETLDMYIQLSSSAPLSTLQSYESTLHSLAANPTQRSVRFQPAKSSLRAFVHSLATDWGFASESFDPEPHRHVFVLKPTVWNPPLLGMGNGTAIGIGGMSVSECVKLRERQRQKEREAQRLAAAEAKAQREAVKAQANATNEGGWAQVAASRRSNASTRSTTPNPGTTSRSGSMFAALAGDDGSTWGVGAGKQLRTPQPAAEVVDSWEEEEEKQEQEERAREQEQGQEQDDGQGDVQQGTSELETAQTGEAIATSSVV